MKSSSPAPFAALARLVPIFGFCLISIAAGWPTAAGGQSLKTSRGDLLIIGPEGALVVSPGGARRQLPLPKAARVTDLRSSPESWFAAAVAIEDGSPSLHLFEGKSDGVETLPVPAQEHTKELAQPVFVADGRGIRALVWFAGEAHHQHAVRAAEWLDGHWGETQTISPPGKGTQIALATAALDDGSSLAVWAAFDGQDDEILWSRQLHGSWSRPRPIAEDNAVPDVTPSLFPTAGGALVTWSRYDGNDYRVNVSRFDGEGWTSPTVVGSRGTTEPTFSDAAKPYLIYHRADPVAWGVIELDASGKALRETSIEIADPRRPVLFEVSERTVTLAWTALEKQMVSVPLRWSER